MSTAKKMLYMTAAGLVTGAVLGVLYAPAAGAETRKQIRRFKHRFSCAGEELTDDKETLEELSILLQKQLDHVNDKLGRI